MARDIGGAQTMRRGARLQGRGLAYALPIQREQTMFQWDRNSLRKIREHRILRTEAEQALTNNPIPIYEQDVEGEVRFVYCGETDAGRLLAVIVAERSDQLRVVTAHDLDAGQKRDYFRRGVQGD
jgi:uncharacterized DUF497 family protein